MCNNKSWNHTYPYKGNASAKCSNTNGGLVKIPSNFGLVAITNKISEASQYNLKEGRS
jgi:hypothetical protein